MVSIAADTIGILRPLIFVGISTTSDISQDIISNSAEGTKAATDIVAGTVNSAIDTTGNVLTQSSNDNELEEETVDDHDKLQKDINEDNKRSNDVPEPDDATSKTQKVKGKSGFCYIGEDRGFRSCIEVNENDITRVNLGDTSIIEVDAFLGEYFKGIVSEIANSADVMGASADQVTNFEVKIRVLDIAGFRPGMTATVEIRTSNKKQVLSVPIQAVTTRIDSANEQEKTECVFVYENGKATSKYVETGIQDDKNIHIISGLEDSVQVISGPYSAVSKILKDGMRVSVEEAEKE